MNIFCRLGWHNWLFKQIWLPNFYAEIVEEVISKRTCKRCPKEEIIDHWIWIEEVKKMNNE